jgi:hypothetical protein
LKKQYAGFDALKRFGFAEMPTKEPAVVNAAKFCAD